MRAGALRPLGGTGLTVSAVAVGGGPLGGMPELFGEETPEQQAIDTVSAVLASPIRVIDTANGYAGGASERRVGLGIARAGGLPPGFLVATKVDPAGRDYSGDRVRASVDESRRRLGLDVLPLVHLHDPEHFAVGDLTARGGAVDALVRLREQGVIGHLGLAGGPPAAMAPYLDLGVFEVLLVHNRLTVVDRGADAIVDRAVAAGLGVVNAAVYGGGILAAPHCGRTTYGYRPAAPEMLRAVERFARLCAEAGITPAAAALGFSLRDPRIATTVCGITSRQRLAALVDDAEATAPPGFWNAVDAGLPPRSAWLDGD